MQFDPNVLTGTEKRIFALRTLYSAYGYAPYRMKKFEEYDLYSRYKDFLMSDQIITFTDTNGRLKALKPDVTLSIVRNIDDRPEELQRLYYDENVYRVSESTRSFREIMQMGLEIIGDADNPSVTEVLDLAERSLGIISEGHDYVLKVSDLDILTLLLDDITDSRSLRSELLHLAGEKNLHGIEAACRSAEIEEQAYRPLLGLLGLYGSPEEVFPELEKVCKMTSAEPEVKELVEVVSDLEGERNIVIDFSLTSDTSYYNGIAFVGYIDGVPESVLVGGRYDMLMQRMKKKSRAIGFAVYLDNLVRLKVKVGDEAISRFYRSTAAHTGNEAGDDESGWPQYAASDDESGWPQYAASDEAAVENGTVTVKVTGGDREATVSDAAAGERIDVNASAQRGEQ